jgi:hypothetical protein
MSVMFSSDESPSSLLEDEEGDSSRFFLLIFFLRFFSILLSSLSYSINDHVCILGVDDPDPLPFGLFLKVEPCGYSPNEYLDYPLSLQAVKVVCREFDSDTN